MEQDMVGEDKKEVRIRFLEDQARWNLRVSNLITSLGDLHHEASVDRAPGRLFTVTADIISQIADFKAMGFFLVNEENADFVLTKCQPEEKGALLQKAVDHQIDNGSFAWALNQNNPVLAKPGWEGQTLVLHVLATPRRVRGMFVGLLDGELRELPEKLYFPLSIMIQGAAKGLESIALYELFEQQNRNLEFKVQARTRELEKQTALLREEVACRLLAEEALQEACDQAERALIEKEEFLANVSHEIRTPLNAILGYGEMIRFDLEKLGQPHLLEDFSVLDSAGRHLMSMVDDLLDMIKLKSGKLRVERETFKLSTWSNELKGSVEVLAQKNENRLIWEMDSAVGEVETDPVRLRQILLNLLSNACKYTRKGSISFKVRRETRGSQDWVVCQVADDGIGIDPEKMKALYEKFERGKNARDRNIEGTGLGLPLCLKLCEMLGGSLHIESDPGKGTRATVEVPAVLPAELVETDPGEMSDVENPHKFSVPSHEIKEPQGETSNAGNLQDDWMEPSEGNGGVLVVEHDPVLRNLLCRFVEKEGFSAEIQTQTDRVIDQVRMQRPELLVLGELETLDEWKSMAAVLQDYSRKSQMKLVLIPNQYPEAFSGEEKGLTVLRRPFDWELFRKILENLKQTSSGLQALLIQSDSTGRDRFRRLFVQEGWGVSVAKDLRAGMSQARNHKPDLILLEMQNVQESGSFLKVLEEKMGKPPIPVILLTNRELSDEENQLLGIYVRRVFKRGHFNRQDLLAEMHQVEG